MRFERTITSFLKKFAMAAYASATAISSAHAIEISIDENDITSLAGSPFVNQFSGHIDAAGRPSISLDLTFANQCVLDAGIVATHIISGDDRSDIVVLERVIPQEGCPDIAMPVNQRLQVLLPSGVVDNDIQLISRPWRAQQNDMRSQRLSFSDGINQSHDEVVEVSTITGRRLAPVVVEAIQPITRDGYALNGTVGLGQCASSDLEALLYEVPDSDGSPVADLLIFTVPEACTPDQTNTDFSIKIAVPPRGIKRTVTIANEANPVSREIK